MRRARSARGRGLLAVLAAALVLAGCSTNHEPKAYGDKSPTDVVFNNFTKSCTTLNTEKISADAAHTFCECVYDAIEKARPLFADFKALDTKLRDAFAKPETAPKNKDDLAKIDADYAAIVENCRVAGP